jgi:hypothetical protein
MLLSDRINELFGVPEVCYYLFSVTDFPAIPVFTLNKCHGKRC